MKRLHVYLLLLSPHGQCVDPAAGRGCPSRPQRLSYILLTDGIRRVSASPEADLHDLFRRMCFNTAISNLDDHPRNHAVIAKNRGWRLSPAYDLTPVKAMGATLPSAA